MTKLAEWVTGVVVYLAVWYTIVQKQGATGDLRTFVLLFPVLTLGLFGIYSAVVVLWRVYSFNDCPEAAEELQKHIAEAKEDLKKRGLQFT